MVCIHFLNPCCFGIWHFIFSGFFKKWLFNVCSIAVFNKGYFHFIKDLTHLVARFLTRRKKQKKQKSILKIKYYKMACMNLINPDGLYEPPNGRKSYYRTEPAAKVRQNQIGDGIGQKKWNWRKIFAYNRLPVKALREKQVCIFAWNRVFFLIFNQKPKF